MVKFLASHSKMHIEEKLGVIKDQGHFYQLYLLRVRVMANLSIGVKSLSNQYLGIHWYHRVDIMQAYQMIFLK